MGGGVWGGGGEASRDWAGWSEGKEGGGVRGPETGLAGRRPRSQTTKTSGAGTP